MQKTMQKTSQKVSPTSTQKISKNSPKKSSTQPKLPIQPKFSAEPRSLITFSDGGARGNPGPAAIGVVLYADDGNGGQTLVGELKKYIGEQTNNFAEYAALITALSEGLRLGYQRVSCFLDSELVVKQMNGQYKVREESLKLLFAKARDLVADFDQATFTHVRREKNSRADALVNQALDAETGG
jgi:ribonuclease HI